MMNAAVRLYADAANAKTKMENGFDLTDYDNRTLAFAKDYSEKLLAIDVNLDRPKCSMWMGLVTVSISNCRSEHQTGVGRQYWKK